MLITHDEKVAKQAQRCIYIIDGPGGGGVLMFFQSLKMALTSISASKMRSFLTMLGIIIGVTALVVMVSLVSGCNRSGNQRNLFFGKRYDYCINLR